MEKVLNLDGREVKFRATASLALIYKAHFHRDLLADVTKLQRSWKGPSVELSATEIETGVVSEENAKLFNQGSFDETFDTSIFYDIVWAMAKCANPYLKPAIEWYDQFENGLSIFSVFSQLSDMLAQSFQGTIKN